MPFCEGYEKLEMHDKKMLTGEMIHCFMFDQIAFEEMCKSVNESKGRGTLDGVKFGSDIFKDNAKPSHSDY